MTELLLGRRRIAVFLALFLFVVVLLTTQFRSSDQRAIGPQGRLIRVQVLNGSREGGIGARVAHALRDGGFQVVEVTNADRSDYATSLVVARREDLATARVVAKYLGDPPIVRQAWTSDVAEVTVVIGSDRSRLRVE